jgi:hypothetical protein
MIKMVQQLPASASVVEATLPGLNYLDSRAAAALLKGLAKAGLGQRAVDIFDYLRWVAAAGSLILMLKQWWQHSPSARSRGSSHAANRS